MRSASAMNMGCRVRSDLPAISTVSVFLHCYCVQSKSICLKHFVSCIFFFIDATLVSEAGRAPQLSGGECHFYRLKGKMVEMVEPS